jgi:hypothetical protein
MYFILRRKVWHKIILFSIQYNINHVAKKYMNVLQLHKKYNEVFHVFFNYLSTVLCKIFGFLSGWREKGRMEITELLRFYLSDEK